MQKFRNDRKMRGIHNNYIPVTMDELMVRFVHNINRNDKLDQYRESSKLLHSRNLRKKSVEEVENSVTNSLLALKDLL